MLKLKENADRNILIDLGFQAFAFWTTNSITTYKYFLKNDKGEMKTVISIFGNRDISINQKQTDSRIPNIIYKLIEKGLFECEKE